jgi:hypothetical protein
MQGRDDIARIASARAVEIASRAISLASSVKGEKGDKGEPGEIVLKNVPVPGEKGEQGDKGERGYTGAQGEKGDKGDKGDRGTDAVGAKGDKGDKGDTGPQGERGFTGPKGFKGDEGERGLTGPMPKHEIKGLKFRFQQDDGDWGKWIIVPTGGGGGGRDDKLFDRQAELVIIADAYKNNTNPFPDNGMVYPAAGIPNSTGSAWGTSFTAPSGTIVGTTDTQTLSSKRITPRVLTTASSATPTINTDNTDQFGLTAQAVDITSFTTNLTGTPTDGQKLWIYIVGTAARAIAWGASFESSTATLPTTTVTTNRLDVGFVWNAATSKWRCVAVA